MSSRGDLTLDDGRALSSLRVVDLKAELEKRSLSKSGSKKDLSDRLRTNILVEREKEGTSNNDALPNISMQDKLAEQNPFIREYFASQAEQFHSQSVVKQLYHDEMTERRSRSPTKPVAEEKPSDEQTKEEVVPVIASPEKEVMTRTKSVLRERIQIHPIPQEPLPLIVEPSKETEVAEAVDQPADIEIKDVKVAKRQSESPVKITSQDKPLDEQVKEKIKPVQVSSPDKDKSRVISQEQIQSAPVTPVQEQLSAEANQKTIIADAEKSVETVEIKETIQKSSPSKNIMVEDKPSEEQTKDEKELLMVASPVKDKPTRARRFFTDRIQPEPTPDEPITMTVETHQEPDLPDKPAVIERRESVERRGRSKITFEDKSSDVQTKETELVVVADPVKDKSSRRRRFEERIQPDPVPAEPVSVEVIQKPDLTEKHKVEERKESSERRGRTKITFDDKPTDVKAKEPEPVIVSDPAKERSSRRRRFEERIQPDPVPDEPLTVQAEQEPIFTDAHVEVEKKEGSKRRGPKKIVFDDKHKPSAEAKEKIEPIVIVADEDKPIRTRFREKIKFGQTPDKRLSVEAEETPEESMVIERRGSQEHKIKRTVSVVTSEGIDDDVLDYGDEEKDRKELPKFIWTPRILRLPSNFSGGVVPPVVSWIPSPSERGPEHVFCSMSMVVSSSKLLSFYPEADLIAESELKLGKEDRSPTRKERSPVKITRTISNDPEGADNGDVETSEEHEGPKEDLRSLMDFSIKMKVSTDPFNTDKSEKELTPPRNSPSNIIMVTNLVRPFTLIQLRELLQRTGNITEFWVDKIKSRCIAKFEKDDEAYETRAALHGVRWPASNPKTLHVDFTTEDRLDNLRDKENSSDVKPKTEDKPQTVQILPVREWDLGKRDRERSKSPGGRHKRKTSRSTSRDRKRPKRTSAEPSKARRSSRSPQRERKARNNEAKKEPEASGKALDELFRKTTAIPCIYWLPLTPQQISEKEELRRKRMAERERRISEIKLRGRN